jgi:1-deoxy-D-xylulose-5-phosphate reductoisomerase
MPQRVAVLGSTGSIGSQTLDVISRFPENFIVEALIAGNNIETLVSQAKKFHPRSIVIGNTSHYNSLREALSGTNIEISAGAEAIEQVVASSDTDIVVASIVGYSGLRPTVAAIRAGKRIALANKETLVVAGELISHLVREAGSTIIPVDSEHSAIFQCLTGENRKNIEKITLTASGGPFLNWTTEKLDRVTPEEALRHPNWCMGNKVTIDSASLMNKGLEVIEAKWLFDLTPDQISVTIHPQSVIHSFVHFTDGSVKAQLGVPDMRIPILYAMTYPERLESNLPRLDFRNYPTLTFSEPDMTNFRNLSLAYDSLREGGNMCCILNAANEMAVDAFLTGKIGFLQMPDVVRHAMDSKIFSSDPDLDSLAITDTKARDIASKYINKLYSKR